MSAADGKRMDEAALSGELQRAGAGDPEAFDALFRHFHLRVLRLCRYLLGSSAEAEDAASEVFSRLPRTMKSYDISLPFPPWLMSVASHYCLDLLRKRQVEKRIFETGETEIPEIPGAQPSPLQELLSAETRDGIRTAIEALPDRYRVPLVLRYYNDLTYDEIAAELQLTRAHVGTLIFRAKKELRVALSKLAEKEGRESSR
jgi:RNA polymerase sigma-70 factor (ECF subfamily)